MSTDLKQTGVSSSNSDEKNIPKNSFKYGFKEKELSTNKNNFSDYKPGACYIPRRYIMAVMCFIGMVLIHAMRVGLGIVVITILDDRAGDKVGSETARGNIPQVKWTPAMVGILHGTFYLGFLMSQIPGGYISLAFPSTWVFGLSILFSSMINCLIPLGIASGVYEVTCFIRFAQGVSEGLCFPALYAVMNKWFPHKSVHNYGGWIFGGMYAGPIIGFPVDGAITHYLSWEYVFYIHSISGIIWYLFWFLISNYDKPTEHPYISQAEILIINEDRPKAIENIRIPWSEILKSPAVWAINVCHCCRSWMFFLMLTNEPMYLNQFHFTIFENGLFSALPHILKVAVSFTSGYMVTALLQSGSVSRTSARKLFTCVGFGVEAAACFTLAVVNEGHIALAVLCLGIGMSGLAVSGWQINHLDLAPNYASVLVGLSATIGTLGGILGPVIVGFITSPQTLWNWQKSFILTGSVLSMAVIAYGFLGSGDMQSWADNSEIQSFADKEAKAKEAKAKEAKAIEAKAAEAKQ